MGKKLEKMEKLLKDKKKSSVNYKITRVIFEFKKDIGIRSYNKEKEEEIYMDSNISKIYWRKIRDVKERTFKAINSYGKAD